MYRVGIIGCGGRGKRHAQGYLTCPQAEIVACADPVGEARWAFQEDFEVPRTYKSYRDMLESEQLDIVSICTWPADHGEMVLASVGRGVKAVHCEKPMAPTWGEAKAMDRVCREHGALLTCCHQRRFEALFLTARRLLKEGAVGELVRLEATCSNLFDWGTHWFDMFFFYNDEAPAEWVLGQIDASEDRKAFGIPIDSAGISWIRWKNGVEGMLATGAAGMNGPANRLIGTDGIIDVGVDEDTPLRFMRHGGTAWEKPPLEETGNEDATVSTVLDLVDALDKGRTPELDSGRALKATELIFATYESSRRRGRVHLPLAVDDSAFLSMLEAGEIG